jgi:crotonobetainyl-CoA:carnitine CoA-transferase CaiB-like acyl-CoA transferase
LRDADVVVDNFSRRVLPNFGLDDDALHALNPRLVIAHLAGFPAGDPRADWVSFAPTLHALSGLTDAMRSPGGAPAGPGFAYADTASGWAAALAVVAALETPGARLDLAQRDLLAWMLAPLLAAPAAPPPAAIHRCADADGAERWCAITGAGTAGSAAARLAAVARALPAEVVVDRAQAAGVAAAVVATPADLAADPQLCVRGWWRRVDGLAQEGLVPRVVPPFVAA